MVSDVTHRQHRLRSSWTDASHRWTCLCREGRTLVAQIGQMHVTVPSRSRSSSPDTSSSCQPVSDVERLCGKLLVVVDSLQEQVLCLEKIAVQLEAVQQLLLCSEGSAQERVSGDTGDLAASCTSAGDMAAGARRLLDAFRRELAVKRVVASAVAHCHSTDTLHLYKAAWKHDACFSPADHHIQQAVFECSFER